MNPATWRYRRGRWSGQTYVTCFVSFLVLAVIVVCGLIWWLA